MKLQRFISSLAIMVILTVPAFPFTDNKFIYDDGSSVQTSVASFDKTITPQPFAVVDRTASVQEVATSPGEIAVDTNAIVATRTSITNVANYYQGRHKIIGPLNLQRTELKRGTGYEPDIERPPVQSVEVTARNGSFV